MTIILEKIMIESLISPTCVSLSIVQNQARSLNNGDGSSSSWSLILPLCWLPVHLQYFVPPRHFLSDNYFLLNNSSIEACRSSSPLAIANQWHPGLGWLSSVRWCPGPVPLPSTDTPAVPQPGLLPPFFTPHGCNVFPPPPSQRPRQLISMQLRMKRIKRTKT